MYIKYCNICVISLRLIIKRASVLVDKTLYYETFSSVNHLFRNCMPDYNAATRRCPSMQLFIFPHEVWVDLGHSKCRVMHIATLSYLTLRRVYYIVHNTVTWAKFHRTLSSSYSPVSWKEDFHNMNPRSLPKKFNFQYWKT